MPEVCLSESETWVPGMLCGPTWTDAKYVIWGTLESVYA